MPPTDRQREQGFDAFRRGDFAAVRRLLTPAAMSGEPQAALYAAESAFRMGEGGSARYFVDRLLGSGRSPEDAHMAGAAVVLTKMGDTQTAERLLMQSAQSHPDWLGVRLELVALYLMTGRPNLAEPVLQQMDAAGAEPDLMDRLRADVLRANGRIEDARELYDRALTRAPDDLALAEITAYLTNLSDRTTARDGFEAHARFGQLLERTTPRLPARALAGGRRPATAHCIRLRQLRSSLCRALPDRAAQAS
ncbi:MAG: tetratricopeptide repeat protein [Phycisphaerales bacterium]